MRARLAAVAAVIIAGSVGCSGSVAEDAPTGTGEGQADPSGGTALTGTLTVFAAASLTDVFTELGDQLMQKSPSLDVRFNFAGSSALATQILQGAPADVFAAADETQMARLDDAGLAEDPEVFAQNSLMLALPPGNPGGIETPEGGGIAGLDDLIRGDPTLAVCAPEVPCGAAAAEVLDAAGLADVPDTYEDDARAVLTKVQLGEVDAGLVYVSDVHAAGNTIIALAFREAATAVNRYPVAPLADAPHPAAAQAFTQLVLSDTGQQILRDAGFQAP